MLSLFFACSSGGYLSSPLPIDLIQEFKDIDMKEFTLEIQEKQEEFTVGKVKTLKKWGDGEEVNLSYVPLMNGDTVVGILNTEVGETDRDEQLHDAKEHLSSTFVAPSQSNWNSLLNSKKMIFAAAISPIDLSTCVYETIDKLQQSKVAEFTASCENFTTPNTEYYQYVLDLEIKEIERDISQNERDYSDSEEYLERRNGPLRDKKAFLKKLKVEDYIKISNYYYRNVDCAYQELYEDDTYSKLVFGKDSIEICMEYLEVVLEHNSDDK